MNREEFLRRIEESLRGSGEEKESTLAYYREMLMDMTEDGMSEEEAVAELSAGMQPTFRLLRGM